MKAIQTTNNQGGKFSLKLKNHYYIKHNRNINKTGLLSAFTFLLLALTCLFPISKGEQNTEAVTGTVQSSSLTLNVSQSAASVELDVNSMAGTFASSTADNSAIFSVTTNNFSGYTLTISGNDDDGKLYDSTKQNFLTSISTNVTETDFSSNSNTDLNGQWGYKPSKFNSSVNENYLPAPTTEASTLDKTTTANTTANDYSISLGIRADYTTTANIYSNSFIITAVPNPIAYVITYDANTTDTVSNMPTAQNSTTSATSITLADKTPTREDYDFKGWCTVAPTTSNPDTCTGTTFQSGDTYGIDQTTENIITLYAVWESQGTVVTYDANGGYFEGNESKTTNRVRYEIEKVSTKFISDTDYDSEQYYYSDSVTITDAMSLTVSFECLDVSSYEYIYIYDGQYNLLASCEAGADTPTSETFTVSGNMIQFDVSTEGLLAYNLTVDGFRIVASPNYSELTPTRPGYTFLGWYTNAEATDGNEFELNTSIKSGTVYAKWGKTLTVVAGDNISKVTGSGAYAPGTVVTITATSSLTSSDCISTTPTWTANPEATGSLTTNSGTSITYVMGTTDDTLTATSTSAAREIPIQILTSGGAASATVNGVTLADQEIIYLQCGTYNITGTFASEEYPFYNWYAGRGTLGSSTTLATTYTVRGRDTLVLNGSNTATYDMQNFTLADCKAKASDGNVFVQDQRDQNKYTARYINGNCWMTQNLRFVPTTGMTLSPATSNVASDTTLGTVGKLTSGNSYTEARILSGSSATGYGYYYNFCAASAGTICTQYDETESVYDICPANWHLPSYDEMQPIAAIPEYLSQFSPVVGGMRYSGVMGLPYDGYWWTRTADTEYTYARYRLNYGIDYSVEKKAYIRSTSRTDGLYMRCIRST